VKDLDITSLRMEKVANLDASIACKELDELKSAILELNLVLRSVGLTDDFPAPVRPITLLGGK
jgi:hypothetical protein